MNIDQAAANIDSRAAMARQIVTDINNIDNARLMPKAQFNDDYWYVYETDSLMLVRTVSSKVRDPSCYLKPGQTATRGLSAKHLGLWRIEH